MKVFVTGATGYIGSYVINLLLEKKHQVVGLCRNEEGAAKLRSKGVTPLIGDVREPQKIVDAAKQADAVLHLAFIHDFNSYTDSIQVDMKLTEEIISALAGTNKPFIATSGTALSGDTTVSGPFDDYDTPKNNQGRAAVDEAVRKGAEKGVRTSVIRLPAFVFGNGGKGFAATMIKVAKERGEANYIEGLTNRVNFVHVEDAARLYIDVLEKGKAGNAYHGATESVEFKKLAESIGEMLKVPVKAVSKEEAAQVWGPFLSMVFGWDIRSSAKKAEKELGWKPLYPFSITDDIVKGSYKQNS